MKPVYSFLLERYAGNRLLFLQGQLLIAFCLVEAGIGLVYFFVHPVLQFHVPRALFPGLILLNLGVLFSLRTPLPLAVIAHIKLAVVFCFFCVGIALSGGIFSPVASWLVITPVMASLLVHRRAAWGWGAVSMGALVFFFFWYDDPQPVLDPKGDWRAMFSTAGLMVTILAFTHLFQKSRAALLLKVAQKSKKLERRKNRLIEQNEEIAAQKSFIDRQYQALQQQKHTIEQFNRLLTERVQQITQQNKKLEVYWQTLLAISRSPAVHSGAFLTAIQEIVHTAAVNLSIDRVGVWRYDRQQHSIRCLHLFDSRNGYAEGDELNLHEFPAYFGALQREQVIVADHAHTHAETFELKQAYLNPRKIISMLDTPFFLDGTMGGVLCCEHHEERRWGHEDILFVQALADIVALAFRAQDRRMYEAHLLDKQEEITRANESLEQRVKDRTHELEAQNLQLAEYAYINSHLLRAPLSRLLGLVNLLRYTQVADPEKELIIGHIKTSGEELDEVVRKINEALGVRNTVTRDEIDGS